MGGGGAIQTSFRGSGGLQGGIQGREKWAKKNEGGLDFVSAIIPKPSVGFLAGTRDGGSASARDGGFSDPRRRRFR